MHIHRPANRVLHIKPKALLWWTLLVHLCQLPTELCLHPNHTTINLDHHHKLQIWLSEIWYKTEYSHTRAVHTYLTSSRWTYFNEFHDDERPSWMRWQSANLHQPTWLKVEDTKTIRDLIRSPTLTPVFNRISSLPIHLVGLQLACWVKAWLREMNTVHCMEMGLATVPSVVVYNLPLWMIAHEIHT